MNIDQIPVSASPILSLSQTQSNFRLAVLTEDNTISFFRLNKEKKYDPEGPSTQIRTSSFAASKIKFAPPEYGSFLAVADINGGVHLYSESCEEDGWRLVKEFCFPIEKITDFKFSPSFMGPLQLAIASSFGILRVFRNSDVLYADKWELVCQETVTSNTKGIKSISWCKNPFYVPTIAVLFEYEFKEHSRLEYHTDIVLYAQNGDAWKFFDKLPRQSNFYHYSEDISWGRSLGKTYETLACCGEDGVCVWSFWLEKDIIKKRNIESVEIECGCLKKVDWNPTGSVFSCMEEEGKLFLCREVNEKWKCLYKFDKKV